MNHSVKRRRQALHQTHHHFYLNISVQAANLSYWRIEKIDSVARIESNRIETFLPELECSSPCLLRICEVIDMSGERIFCRSCSCHILWATVTLWRVESDTQSFHEMHGFGTELEESNTVAHKCQRPENPQHNSFKLLCCGFLGNTTKWNCCVVDVPTTQRKLW